MPPQAAKNPAAVGNIFFCRIRTPIPINIKIQRKISDFPANSLAKPPLLLYHDRYGGDSMNDPTISFSIHEDKDREMKETLLQIYDALNQKGYNPINQIVGYILSEDPTYITTHNNARSLIRRIDRDELLNVLLKNYLQPEEE